MMGHRTNTRFAVAIAIVIATALVHPNHYGVNAASNKLISFFSSIHGDSKDSEASLDASENAFFTSAADSLRRTVLQNKALVLSVVIIFILSGIIVKQKALLKEKDRSAATLPKTVIALAKATEEQRRENERKQNILAEHEEALHKAKHKLLQEQSNARAAKLAMDLYRQRLEVQKKQLDALQNKVSTKESIYEMRRDRSADHMLAEKRNVLKMLKLLQHSETSAASTSDTPGGKVREEHKEDMASLKFKNSLPEGSTSPAIAKKQMPLRPLVAEEGKAQAVVTKDQHAEQPGSTSGDGGRKLLEPSSQRLGGLQEDVAGSGEQKPLVTGEVKQLGGAGESSAQIE